MVNIVRAIRRIRSFFCAIKRRARVHSIECSVSAVFILMVTFNLIATACFFWPGDDEYFYFMDALFAVPMPVQIQAPERAKTIQDRFKYSAKELKSQVEVEIIQQIRVDWLKAPSGKEINQSLLEVAGWKRFPWVQQVRDRVMEVLPKPNLKNGFYVEYGVYQGFTNSFTLQLEVWLKWNGLLIEADPTYYQDLMEFGRNAWSINSCLSIHPKVEKQKMLRFDYHGRSVMEQFMKNNSMDLHPEEFQAQCFPLISILLAANVTDVDLLCLNSEGAALHILKTHIWHLVNIKIILIVEYNRHKDKTVSFNAVLSKRGYISRGVVPGDEKSAYIFVHENYLPGFNK